MENTKTNAKTNNTKKINVKKKAAIKSLVIGGTKLVVGTAASFGAGYIISRYGKGAIMPSDKTLKKVVMLIGAAALSGAVGDIAANQVDKTVDNTVCLVDNICGKLFKDDDFDEDFTDDDPDED